MAPKFSLTSFLSLPLRKPVPGGLLLCAVLFSPERLRPVLTPKIFALVTSIRVIRALKLCFIITLVRSVSSILSRYVLNDGKSAAPMVQSQELILITGGASGIGMLMAESFAARGIKVVILDLRPPKVSLPKNIHYYTCDITKSSEIATIAATIRSQHGHPTVLINNAGITGSVQPILAAEEKDIRQVFEVNTISHFLMVKEYLPEMVKRNHGHVVTIASMSAYVTVAGMVDYACTKNSAVAFNEGLRQELRARYNAPNVRTTLVTPSWIRTPLIEPLLDEPSFRDPVLEADEVSSAVVNQVMSGHSGHIMLPTWEGFVSGIRGWPVWLQETLRNGTGKTLAAAVTADRSTWWK